jgi:hypothetical protein
MSQPAFKLSDEFIGQVAKLVQLGILTGTNVVDHLRLVLVTTSEDGQEIVLTSEYRENFNANIEKMLAEVEEIKEEMRSTVAQA